MKHIVLVTYGEPPSPSFVDQLVYSWRILLGLTRSVADIPSALIPVIALSRARGRNSLWRRYQYSSPLEAITIEQAAQVRQGVARQSGESDWRIHIAYEFRSPLLSDVIARLPAHHPVFVAPMYAADSAFTHELSRRTAQSLLSGRSAPIEVLPPLDVEALAELSAAHVLASIEPEVTTSTTALVLAAHGTLLEPQRPIETGRVATQQLCEAIQKRLEPRFGMVAYGWLNHSRGGRWTDPPMDETLKRVSDAGYRDVVYYPYGFLADNAESQLEGQIFAEARPELRVRFVPCLNGSPSLGELIANQIAASETVASPPVRHQVPA